MLRRIGNNGHLITARSALFNSVDVGTALPSANYSEYEIAPQQITFSAFAMSSVYRSSNVVQPHAVRCLPLVRT